MDAGILHTERLVLIPLTERTLRELAAGDPSAGATQDLQFPPTFPDDPQARDGLPVHADYIASGESPLWRVRVVVSRRTREVLGSVSLKGPPDEAGDVEIGWGVEARHRNQGIAREAAAAVIAWVLDQPDAERVFAAIAADNAASIRVARALGMTPTPRTHRGLPVWECDAAPGLV